MRRADRMSSATDSGLRLRRWHECADTRSQVQGGPRVGAWMFRGSIALARQSNYGAGVSFLCTDEWTPDGTMELAFCNGVFHHIPLRERHDCLVAIRRALRPGGLFAFWENNPWNPGTRYVMSQCAFDENAITISPREARKILSGEGFRVLRTDSLFYFPRQLRLLQSTERWFRHLPVHSALRKSL
ncbi:hypothetical protein SBA1_530062 [Candidatus Sulfotelmatobacter kueseliae]|uniref:Methyltransferase type 11 domain-containing protein n=1 Tax=Candidatus Sulfotelmatobacter kueseliae TaxID=2042962 RepID=A0A2U3KXL9_9BACT|nr:hypothetical protein SBA1_530062 [Candidatus Sulfotelmatobacter kueseliae]